MAALDVSLQDAAGIVVAAMRADSADLATQSDGLVALSQLAQQPGGDVAAGAAGAIETAVTAMRAFPGDAQLQRAACYFLSHACEQVAANLGAATAAGATEAVVAALRAHRAHVDMVRQGCLAAGVLAGNDATCSLRFVRAGGVSVAVATMLSYRVEATLLATLLCVLSNVVHQLAAKGVRQPKEPACVDIVCAVLRGDVLPRGGEDALDRATQLLMLLCSDADNAERAVRAGALEALLRRLPVVANVERDASLFGPLQRVCFALSALCATDDAHASVAVALGAAEKLLAVMFRHANEPEVQSAVCAALHSLCYVDEAAAGEVLRRGALPVAQAALLALGADRRAGNITPLVTLLQRTAAAERVHAGDGSAATSSPAPAAAASGAGASSASAPTCTSTAVAAIAQAHQRSDAAAVIAVMREHVSDADVQLAGARALPPMLCSGDRLLARAWREPAAVAVVAAMRAHPARADVQYAAIHVLGGVSHAAPDELRATGAVEAVVSALRTHAAQPQVPTHACIVLRNLYKYPAYRARAIAAGATRAIAAALHARPADKTLHQAGVATLAHTLPDEAAVQADTAAALDVAMAAMTYVNAPDAAPVYCTLIGSLAPHEAIALTLIAAGAVGALLAVLTDGSRAPSLLLSAAIALGRLTDYEEGAANAMQLRAIEALVRLQQARAHARSAEVQTGCCIALCSLSGEHALAVLRAGALPLAQAALSMRNLDADAHELLSLHATALVQNLQAAAGAADAAADAAAAELLAE
jgi:hypothetical protein